MNTLETLSVSKVDLRTLSLRRRDDLSTGERLASREGLAAAWPGLDTALTVSLYNAIGSEVDPSLLAARLSAQGHPLALPVLTDEVTMVFRRWTPGDALVPAGFGTVGPGSDKPEVTPDIILAPLAAFTASGQRIGYGKGHYDRAVANMRALGFNPRLIGVAFDSQEVPSFPAEAHDVPLGAVLTPGGLRVFAAGKARLAPLLNATERG
ncbi:MAG: 5-formyltetrahydrofolate cyclo-ligase [Pseudomonadota bacterium]